MDNSNEKLPEQAIRAIALYCASLVMTSKHQVSSVEMQAPEATITMADKFVKFIEGKKKG